MSDSKQPSDDAGDLAARDWQRLRSEHVADLILFQACTPDERLVMVRQFRFGSGSLTLETPGGMVDPGEDHGTAAARELLEETGYGDGRWRYLGAVQPNPAIHDHLCHHWLVEDVRRVQPPEPGPGEDVEVLLMTPAEMRAAVADGRIAHSLALSALSRVYELFGARS
jgi:8-oxo-dGTP pyrophosphatase MutT (NUDIX family)